jgi:hypothetical protein
MKGAGIFKRARPTLRSSTTESLEPGPGPQIESATVRLTAGFVGQGQLCWDSTASKAAESIQLARGTLNRYLLILNRLIFESSVRAGRPSLAAAPDGPEIRP